MLKKSEILLPSEICKNAHFFHTSLGCHKKTAGDGEKLLTYLNSALKALLGFDIFPRVPKKSGILLPSVSYSCNLHWLETQLVKKFREKISSQNFTSTVYPKAAKSNYIVPADGIAHLGTFCFLTLSVFQSTSHSHSVSLRIIFKRVRKMANSDS